MAWAYGRKRIGPAVILVCFSLLPLHCPGSEASLEQELSTARSWVAEYPEESWALCHLGFLLLEGSQPGEALPLFKLATRSSPTDPDGWNGLAESYDRLGMKQKAISSYIKAIELDPAGGNYDALSALYLSAGNPGLALKTLEEGIDVRPNDVELFNSRGNLFLSMGQVLPAMAAFEKAASLQPEKADWTNLGFTYLEMGRYGNAERAFRQAISLSPQNPSAWEGLGFSLLERSKLQEAEKVLGDALKRHPREAGLYNALAYTLEAGGKTAEAVTVFLEGDRLGLSGLDLKSLAFDLDTLNRREDAIHTFIRHLKENPDDLEALGGLAYAFASKGERQKAFDMFRKAVLIEGNAKTLSDLGYGYRLIGNNSAAIEAFRRALAKEPHNEEVLFSLGETLLDEGKREEAAKLVLPLMKVNRKRGLELVELLQE